jgi:ankyrin repeat protein
MKSFIMFSLLAVLISIIGSRESVSQDIYTAVTDGNVQLCKQILEKDPGLINLKNPDQLTPLNLAAEQGQTEIAELLLNMGADPLIGDNENSQPIHLAFASRCGYRFPG